MQIDFDESRGDHDLAWVTLQKIEVRELEADKLSYFYLLRAQSEVTLRHWELARRNLRALQESKASGTTVARADSLRAALSEVDGKGEFQKDISELPSNALGRELFWQGVAGEAKRQGRWAEALSLYERLAAEASRSGNPRLAASNLVSAARVAAPRSPQDALSYLRRALDLLTAERGDRESELFRIARTLDQQSLESNVPEECVELRGRTLQLTKSGRARWYLAGANAGLPSNIDRTKLLLDCLQQAEASRDHRVAAWLCLAAFTQVHIVLDNTAPYVDRALQHSLALPAVYPGPSAFDGVTPEAVENWARRRRSKTEHPKLADLPLDDRTRLLLGIAYDSPKELSSQIDLYVDLLSKETPSTNAVRNLWRLFGLGNSNARSWQPDLLSFDTLTEQPPADELLRKSLWRHPEWLSRLMGTMDPGAPASDRMRYAELFVNLGRHHEARRILLELEQELSSPQDIPFRLRVLEQYFRSLSRTGELNRSDPHLDELETCLRALPTDGSEATEYGPLPSIEVMIRIGRLKAARLALDKVIAAAGDDREKLAILSIRSFFVHRAMVGRLLGEPTQKTIGFLERGIAAAKYTTIWGGQVNEAYLAALYYEVGQEDRGDRAYLQSLEDDFDTAASRLQLSFRYDLRHGVSLEQEKERRRAHWERIATREGPELLATAPWKRAAKENMPGGVTPKLTELFLRSLIPTQLEQNQAGARELTRAQFLSYAGELTRRPDAERGFLLPFQLGYLERIQAKLPPGAVLYHPVLLDNRLLKFEIEGDRISVEEFFLNGPKLTDDLWQWASLAGNRLGDPGEMTKGLRPVLWSPRLDQATTVWLLLPRPLDGVPWPLLAPADLPLRWTDGDLASKEPFALSPSLLAGGADDLTGSRRELATIREILPKAQVWSPSSGLEGLIAAARHAEILHLTGHGVGVDSTPRGGELDLGPLKVGLEALFSFDLPQHPMVVLAVCEGGSGYRSAGGRSFSLVTPFRAAGASRVLANIWALDDQDAADFFLEFYRLLATGDSPEEALDALRRRARETGKPSYYWSGFYLIEGL